MTEAEQVRVLRKTLQDILNICVNIDPSANDIVLANIRWKAKDCLKATGGER